MFELRFCRIYCKKLRRACEGAQHQSRHLPYQENVVANKMRWFLNDKPAQTEQLDRRLYKGRVDYYGFSLNEISESGIEYPA